MSKAHLVLMACGMTFFPLTGAADCDSHVIAKYDPVIIATPTALSDRLALDVQVKQNPNPKGKRAATRGVVEVRSPTSGKSIKIGSFSVFPSMEGEGPQQYRFDVSAQAASLKSLGPSLEVDVVAVDAITGEPTSEKPFNVLGAEFHTVN
ncbi:hypothetical protein [Phyllobacterium sp. P5_D12]